MMHITVTTPTGNVGSRVVRLLLQAGVRPTLLLRDPSRLDPEILERVDVRQGDQDDADFVREATAGADVLFWVDPTDFGADEPNALSARMGEHVAAAIRANGIGHTIFQTSIGAEKRHGAGLIDGLARIEEQLDATATNVLHLRCGYFFTNLLGALDTLRDGVLTTTLPPDAPMAWVDPRDIGDVVAARLLAVNWTGREVQAVHGPADLTYTDAAEILSDATGRKIRLEVVSDDDALAALLAVGMPRRAAEGVVGMSSGLREGFTPEQQRSILTTTPTTLGEWAFTHLRPLLHG